MVKIERSEKYIVITLSAMPEFLNSDAVAGFYFWSLSETRFPIICNIIWFLFTFSVKDKKMMKI